jgi:hypothetical protein
MIRIDLRDLDVVQQRLARLPATLQAKALGPAINKVADKARAEINRAIPQEYAVKASEVRNSMELRRASAGKLEASISIFGSARKRGRSLNLIHFLAAVQSAGQAYRARGAKANRRDLAALDGQLGFLIRKAGGLKRIKGAFLGNNGRTIFRRTGKARLPIEPMQVIGFSQMFSSRKIRDRVMAKIDAEMPIEIERAIARLVAQGQIT